MIVCSFYKNPSVKAFFVSTIIQPTTINSYSKGNGNDRNFENDNNVVMERKHLLGCAFNSGKWFPRRGPTSKLADKI